MNVSILSFIFVVLSSIITCGQTAQNLEGIWMGELKIPSGPSFKMVIDVEMKPDSSLVSHLISLDQGCISMAFNNTKFENGQVCMDMKSPPITISGKYSKNSQAVIDGRFQQGGGTFPLQFRHVDQIPGYRRPQTPVRPYPYDEEEVAYENSKAGIKIGGTLTLPRGKGPFPAALLISGSGPQDRNEFIVLHRPFKVLADHLTRRGIAVLRVDDRGVGSTTGEFSKATTRDFADDVLAGVQYLKNRKDIRPDGIGLIGHSEGGMIAPMVAAESPDVSFVVLMAAPGIPIPELMYLQHRQGTLAEGQSEAKANVKCDLYQRFYQIIKQEKNNQKTIAKMRQAYSALSNAEKKLLGWDEGKASSEIHDLVSPWKRYFVSFDPKPYLSAVKCPLLAINGAKDRQVILEENLRGIEKTLKESGNSDYTIVELPGLNHLFQTAETGAESEYSRIEETIAPKALKTISDWINDRRNSGSWTAGRFQKKLRARRAGS
jgi:pimeloyl-ACP methyl ester carboxylesterase